ncbi:MAG: glucose-1-phosphate thymidylyltransferase, partial [Deltaproteobacteria bacterium]|nr:glucose-1-phosphate thymidylyltransferase [Deltaproteobacteria bacterium]
MGEVRDDLEVKATGPKNTIQVFMKGEIVKDVAVILPGAHLFNDTIIIGAGTVVEPGALIKGPVVIGSNSEIRQGAYIRGDCLVGNGCVVGHTTEIKGSIMLDGAKAGHFAYIGDSILGKDVNLGAGTKLANLKIIPGSISIRAERKRYDTGRRKLGAILRDRTETGCNSVTSPGTLIGPHSLV